MSVAVAAEARTSRKRAANAGVMKFTFKEAKKVLKTNTTVVRASGDIVERKRKLENERITYDTKQLLTRLGVNAEEQESFISLSETCNIGKQEFNKQSQQLLFGEGGGAASRYIRGRTGYFANSDDDEYDTVADSRKFSGRFLKNMEDSNLYGESNASNRSSRVQKTELGSDNVYFLTLAVGTTINVSANYGRKPNTLYLCLPPRNGTQHDSRSAFQEHLADLMIMKLYFVARYIYNTLKEEIAMNVTVTNRNGHKRWRYPVFVIKRVSQTGTASDRGTWYKMLKEKIVKGVDEYARKLSVNFYCNII